MKALKRSGPRAARGIASLAIGMLMIGAMGCTGPSPVSPSDDVAISEAVRTRLAADAQTKPFAITVASTDGVVQVSGAVAKSGDRDAVERIARGTPGVRSVDNQVRFGGSMPAPVGTSTP